MRITKKREGMKRVGAAILAVATFASAYAIGEKKGYENGVNVKQEQILNSLGDLKQELTSDLISLMKAKTQLMNSNESNEKTYNLENIYVLDSEGEGIQTYGEAPNYAYRYIFFESNQNPDTWGRYRFLFVSEENGYLNKLPIISTDYHWNDEGSYVIPYRADGILNYVEPLTYYLTDEEFEKIKNDCTYSELENVFYEMNIDDMAQGRILGRND